MQGFASNGPAAMLVTYQTIPVQTSDGTYVAKVDAYRNLSHGAANKGGCDDALKVKDAIIGASRGAVIGMAGGPKGFMDVFSGKGSPDAIAAVLQAFHDFGDAFSQINPPNGSTPVGRCSMWISDPNLPWQDTLQNICHEFIGLDCNGFVGNWMKQCDPTLMWNQDTTPSIAYGKRRQQRASVTELEYWDIIVWVNMSHIAVIVDECGKFPGVFVCQSAGGGPRCNVYTIAENGNGTFILTGGLPAKDVPGPVYIFSPWTD